MTARLPKFVVGNVCDGEVVGTFDPSSWVGEGRGVLLRVGDVLVEGKFSQVNEENRSARVRLNDGADAESLRPGRSYPFLDLYWGDRAVLALDPSRQWRRTAFQPVDAVESFVDGHRLVSKALQGHDEGSVVQGGWDHEHCAICWQKIGLDEPSVGWCSQQGEWLCETCYETYVMTRSIGFVDVE